MVTDDELDRAQAEEAWRRLGLVTDHKEYDAALLALRLAREGWRPLDPLEAEVEKLAKAYEGLHGYVVGPITRDILRKAIERGIEIGRGR